MPQLPGISLFDQVPWRPRPNLQQTLEYPWEALGRNLGFVVQKVSGARTL